jgi:hypothetical protein
MWFNSMRLARRSHSPFRAVLFALFLVVSYIAGSQITWAQSSPQPAAQLPPAWNDAVARLASKIGSIAGSQGTISITVKNSSSLTDADIAAISQALQAELKRLRSSVVPESSAQTQAVVTLSEGEQGYVWIVQVGNGSAEQVRMVSVSKNEEASDGSIKQLITLDKRLVWTQPGKFLDFVEFTNPVGFFSTFLVLEPDRLAFYQSADSNSWKLWQAVSISHSNPWPRDLRGSLDEMNGKVNLPDVTCSGQFETPSSLQCSPEKRKRLATPMPLHVPGHEEAEKVVLFEKCGSESIVLATGNGDWTQPDSIQGYLLPSLGDNAVLSGAAVDVDGPVMVLQRDGRQNAARVVVHNVKTGDYEAYVVTATCGH